MADDDETAPPARGSGLGRKIGPLPLGAWAVILGGAVGLVYFLRSRSAKSAATDSADSAAAGGGGDSATSLIPINPGLGQDQFEELLDAIKGLHGAPSDDDDGDGDDPSTQPAPVPYPPPSIITHKPAPGHPKPKTVTVVKWTRNHTPWNSTLWGIAMHEHVKGGWQYLQKLNHISGDPKKALKPGMKIKLSP